MEKPPRTKRSIFYIIGICFLLFLVACYPVTSVPSTHVPSRTHTWTPNPTNTSTSTATFTPSATFTITPTSTPLVEGLGQVIFSESFDDMDFPFGICGEPHIETGVLVVEGTLENPSPCGIFSGGIYGIEPIPADTTLIVLFKTNSDFNIGIHTGDYSNE